MSIYVTKSFMPPLDEYEKFVERIYDSGILTDKGSRFLKFEEKIIPFLNVSDFH